MKEDMVDELFEIHADLVDIENCIRQLGVTCYEVVQPSEKFDSESFLYFLSSTLRMYADSIDDIETRLDKVKLTELRASTSKM